MSDVDLKLDFLDAVANWFIASAEVHLSSGDLEASLRSAQVAASVLSRQNRRLTSPRLELLLQRAAQMLGESESLTSFRVDETDARVVCLHVLDEALSAGGLTAMATRWIEGDSADRLHCVALLNQDGRVPSRISEAVARSGGKIWERTCRRIFRFTRALAEVSFDSDCRCCRTPRGCFGYRIRRSLWKAGWSTCNAGEPCRSHSLGRFDSS